MRKFVVVAAAAMFAATGVYAQDENSDRSSDEAVQANSSEDEEEEEEPRMICRTEQVTGSLTRRRRTCMTEDEWDELRHRNRDAINATQRGASGGDECILDQFGGCS